MVKRDKRPERVKRYQVKPGGESLVIGHWGVGTVIRVGIMRLDLYHMVEEVILRLNGIYIPFTLGWICQKRRDLWRRILDIEGEINVAIMIEDEEHLKEQLDLFEGAWVEAIMEFDQAGRKYVPF